jgi:teichuronic acid exporter
VNELDARAGRGIRALTGRQLLVQALTFAAGIVLARALTPAQFGLYFIATFFVSTFGFLSDFGLAPSLIQRRDELTDRDLRVAFTLQQALTTVTVALLFAAAPWLVRLYPHAPHETVWLIRALAFQLFLMSLRSLSVLQLERTLSYGRVAAIEVVEALVYQGVAVALALAGFGVWSFAAAVLVRALLGCCVAFAVAPWRIGFAFDRATARGLLRFGIPFQLGALAQQAGGWLTPLFVGSLVGPNAVGLLTWASSNGRKPLMVVENVMRVAFPHFSRLQDDRLEVERVLVRYLRPLVLASCAWLAGIVVAAPGLVPAVYGHRWTPAIGALMLFAGSLCVDTIAWVLGISLVGLGQVGLNARVNLLRTGVYVALGVALVLAIGFVGVAIAAIVSVAAMVPLLLRGYGDGAGRRLLLPLVPAVVPPLTGVAAGLLVRATPVSEPSRSIAAGVACELTLVAVAAATGVLPLRWRRLRPVVPEAAA